MWRVVRRTTRERGDIARANLSLVNETHAEECEQKEKLCQNARFVLARFSRFRSDHDRVGVALARARSTMMALADVLLRLALIALLRVGKARADTAVGSRARANATAGSIVSTNATKARASSPAPAPLADADASDDLFACRIDCREERWSPTCCANCTYANGCWNACAISALRRPSCVATPGRCEPSRERFRANDGCVQDCVVDWARTGYAWQDMACGEDGTTYTTACFARCSNVADTLGECHDVGGGRRVA